MVNNPIADKSTLNNGEVTSKAIYKLLASNGEGSESSGGAGDGADVNDNAGTVTTTIGHEPGNNKIFPPFDVTTYPSQLIWVAIVFGVFYYVMARIALPKLAGILEVRYDRIASDQDEANHLHAEAEQVLKDYKATIAEAHDNARKFMTERRNAVRQEADKLRQQAEEKLAVHTADARKKINETTRKVVAELDLDALSKEVVSRFTTNADAAVISKAVAEVEANKNFELTL